MSGIIKLSLTILIICTLLIIYYIEADREYILPSREYLVKGHFLVDSDECKIINLHPFNDESMKFYNPVDYIPCRELDLLTYVTKERNVAELHINQTLIPLYSEYEVKCCYSYVTRNPEKGDNGLEMSECEYFSDKVQLDGDIVTVKCQDSFSMLIYENTHSPVMITEEIQTKLNNKKESAISLTLIGIDSISRLNFIRVMPKTFNFVETNDFYSLKGYNKIGDNTYPNVMALLTGMTEKQAEQQCNSSKSGKLDSCPMLWYDFRNFGHITAYAEDDPTIGTFNYGRKGFSHSPTDYYFRTYMLASERLRTKQIDFLTYCVGPESSGEKIINIVKDFEYTFKNAPTFGFYWMNTFSHNNLNMPSSVDDNITNFLQDLQQSGHFNKSIVVFLSDHGMRFGSIRNTHTGWMEERLPYIYFSFPPTFKEKFPVEYNNFLSNEYKLTSPFDLYMTLQHLLVLSGYNYTMKPSIGCHKCKSLFEEIPSKRSCSESGIPDNYCTCSNYNPVQLDEDIQTKISQFLTQNLKHITDKDSQCEIYTLDKILSADVSNVVPKTRRRYYVVRFSTIPKAQFEGTFYQSGTKFVISGDFSRLDSYGNKSSCVEEAYLKKFCYCKPLNATTDSHDAISLLTSDIKE